MRRLLILGAILLGLSLTTGPVRAAEEPIYIILWFDTEDYILPQSDDAAKRLAEMLTSLGVPANFKIVGEKARVLERRGRQDVITALRRHEIGYHANLHSGQPTSAVYLQHSGWEDGAAEFYRRESPGLRDIERIFGVTPISYGQPGSSWAPQSYPALRRMGVRMYLDESGHVGIDDQPFYYGGMLNVTRMRVNALRMDLGKNDNLSRAKSNFRAAAERLRAQGGGTISIYYHPCEFIHREFWDGVNFRRGANPLPSEWRVPPMQSPAEIERNFDDFEKFIRFLQSEPGVKFATGTDLLERYADRSRNRTFSRSDILAIARNVQKEISYLTLPATRVSLSPADSFSLLLEAARGGVAPPVLTRTLDGPARPFRAGVGSAKITEIRTADLARTMIDVEDFLREQGRIPDEVWIGSSSISPADFLATLGALVEARLTRGEAPNNIAIQPGHFTADRQVAEDTTMLWGWVIFPEGFHSPEIMENARLQAWTLKPALLDTRK